MKTVFDVTRMEKSTESTSQVLRQIWFPGNRGCVGGGTEENRGLFDATLQWMVQQVHQLGLRLDFDLTRIQDRIAPDPTIDFENSIRLYRLSGVTQRAIAPDELHESVYHHWRDRPDYRPENLVFHQSNLNTAYSIAEKMLVLQQAHTQLVEL